VSTLEQLQQPEVVQGLATLAERLKHDLGKYVGLQARWLPPDAGLQERREALVQDVLQTRRGPEGNVGAREVWSPFEAVLLGHSALPGGGLVDLAGDPDVVTLRTRMDTLSALRDEAAVHRLEAEGVASAMAACADVATACRSLVRRARAQILALSPSDAED